MSGPVIANDMQLARQLVEQGAGIGPFVFSPGDRPALGKSLVRVSPDYVVESRSGPIALRRAMETRTLSERLAPRRAFGNVCSMGDAPTSPMVPAIVSGAGEDDATLGGALRGLRVLLVDDDSDTLELLDAILTTAGLEVACATSVAQAFELLVAKRPNVIISDIEMPHENGHSFLRNLRSVLDEDGAQTPAIALSGRTRPEDRERGLASGFNLYLTKPTTAVKILRAVQAVASDVPGRDPKRP